MSDKDLEAMYRAALLVMSKQVALTVGANAVALVILHPVHGLALVSAAKPDMSELERKAWEAMLAGLDKGGQDSEDVAVALGAKANPEHEAGLLEAFREEFTRFRAEHPDVVSEVDGAPEPNSN